MEHRRRIGASDWQAWRCTAWRRSRERSNFDIQVNVQDSTPSHFIPRFDDNGEERDRPISISRPQMPASECRTAQTRNNATENTENSTRRTYLPENNKQYYQYHQIVRSKTSYFKIPRQRNPLFYVCEHNTCWVLKHRTFFLCKYIQILDVNSIQIYSNMSKQRLSKSSECSRKFQRLCATALEVAAAGNDDVVLMFWWWPNYNDLAMTHLHRKLTNRKRAFRFGYLEYKQPNEDQQHLKVQWNSCTILSKEHSTTAHAAHRHWLS